MKQQNITAYAGDTLSLRVSVYDAGLTAFDETDFDIDQVDLLIPSLDEEIAGTIASGVVSILVPAGTLVTPGSYPYYVQLASSTAGHIFTILAGTISISALPA